MHTQWARHSATAFFCDVSLVWKELVFHLFRVTTALPPGAVPSLVSDRMVPVKAAIFLLPVASTEGWSQKREDFGVR